MRSFEGDDTKARSNLTKHGVSFEEALPVFLEDWVLIQEDRIVDDELRWLAIWAVQGRILIVVHTVRHEGTDELVRIISVRKANTKEQRRYGKNRTKDHG